MRASTVYYQYIIVVWTYFTSFSELYSPPSLMYYILYSPPSLMYYILYSPLPNVLYSSDISSKMKLHKIPKFQMLQSVW